MHCMTFEPTEENKLVYMDIFKQYTERLEAYIHGRLEAEIKDFSMEQFAAMLPDRKNEIDEDLMELLLSFSDFGLFKDIMLSRRAVMISATPKKKSSKIAEVEAMHQAKLEMELKAKEEELIEGIDLLAISGTKSILHQDEQEEGEERPDLMLNIKGIGNHS